MLLRSNTDRRSIEDCNWIDILARCARSAEITSCAHCSMPCHRQDLVQNDRWTPNSPDTNIHCVSKNGHPFYFCDYSVCCWPILKIFGNIAAKEIFNKKHISDYILMRAWYLIVIPAENTSSRTTVDMNITQQSPTL